MNLYAYCGNNPVMRADPTGHFVISSIVGYALIELAVCIAIDCTVSDIMNISQLEITATSSNVHIENSHLIKTPWVQFGYSVYLNHFNESTKDVIQGSSAGVSFEWLVHNIAGYLGIGGESAKHVDVGPTIFSDSQSHPLFSAEGELQASGVMSLLMQIGYLILGTPIVWAYDLIVNGGF